eukprot:GDKJ01061330.1.p1 GENE.GDKJ01061330.1~~GDKJ01061330.1.p1  ORF type:complete len:666 (-),score=143.62 GDKJ01061330.1:33-2030(-)
MGINMFSNAVKLADLNDFLSPAQDCVKPIIDAINGQKNIQLDAEVLSSKTTKEQMVTERPDLIKSSNDSKAQVNLVDCLACSGCVTSAEAVLIEQQGVPDFLKKVSQRPYSAVSLSVQSCVSLAVENGLTVSDAAHRLCTLFKKVGVKRVYDMTNADKLCLMITESEFLKRLEAYKTDRTVLPVLTSHCPGWICYAEKSLEQGVIDNIMKTLPAQEIQGLILKTVGVDAFNTEQLERYFSRLSISKPYCLATRRISQRAFPLFNCPSDVMVSNIPKSQTGCNGCATQCSSDSLGKTHGCSTTNDDSNAEFEVHIEKNLKNIKDLEIVAKERLSHLLVTNRASDTFHCVLEPCFDKKLEAARPEFSSVVSAMPIKSVPPLIAPLMDQNDKSSASNKTNLVDGVLSTVEILSLLEEIGVQSLKDLPPTPLDPFPLFSKNAQEEKGNTKHPFLHYPTLQKVKVPIIASHFSSNGFGSYLLSIADAFFADGNEKREHFEILQKRMLTQKNKTTTNKHISESASPESPCKMISATGFRNIQNILKFLPNSKKKSATNNGKSNNILAVIEVLACPSGCLNGGGQLHGHRKATESGSTVALPGDVETYFSSMKSCLEEMEVDDALHWDISCWNEFLESLRTENAIEESAVDMVLRCLKPKNENEITAAALKW